MRDHTPSKATYNDTRSSAGRATATLPDLYAYGVVGGSRDAGSNPAVYTNFINNATGAYNMSKVEVKHEDHISPGELDDLIRSIQDSPQGQVMRSIYTVTLLRRYRQILIDAYVKSLHDADPAFWTGQPKLAGGKYS